MFLLMLETDCTALVTGDMFSVMATLKCVDVVIQWPRFVDTVLRLR
jgi:hypothetical protein